VAVSLDGALALEKKRDGRLRVFPMDLRLDEGGRTLMGTSRSVAVAGLGSSTEEAHELSLEGVMALDGPFRHRNDVGSAVDIRRSKERLLAVRKAATAAPP